MKPSLDREWARSLTEKEYEAEFIRRFPQADCRPVQKEFLNSIADAKRKQVHFPMSESDYEPDTGSKDHISESDLGRRIAAAEAEGRTPCIICGEGFMNEHAHAIHLGKMHKK